MKRFESGPELSAALREGLDALEGLDSVDVLQPPVWNWKRHRWVILCCFTVPSGTVWPLPTRTMWYVLVDRTYPAGGITIYPAKSGGITWTFPHQNRNLPGSPNVPWRTGDICVQSANRALGRLGGDPEPLGSTDRLAWRIQRAIDWVWAASHGNLNGAGDRFELPDFSISTDFTVGFSEDAESFSLWESDSPNAGVALLYSPPALSTNSRITVVRSYKAFDGSEVYAPQWGKIFEPSKHKDVELAVWVRFSKVPHLEPWQAPNTWEELVGIASECGIDLNKMMKGASQILRSSPRPTLLCGFPMPARIGEDPVEYFWQALRLPELVPATGTLPGFRNTRPNRERVNHILKLNRGLVLDWVRSENWHPSTRSVRGRYSLELTSRRVLLIGGGALGSVVAELLVRGGVEHVTIIDGESMDVGNMSRHTLTMGDVRSEKASSLSIRLNRLLPHAHVDALNVNFPPTSLKDLQQVHQADLVIETTGNDAVITSLAAFDWEDERAFYSLSLDLHARRIFCFSAYGASFPSKEFFRQIRTHGSNSSDHQEARDLARQGIGCWHPIMPARIDNVWMLAAAAVHSLNEILQDNLSHKGLVIFERKESSEFQGVQRVI